MKKILFILILIGILYSSMYNCKISNYVCYSENKETKDEILISKEKDEYYTQNADNYTFLGLYFGMTLPETYNTLTKLKKINVISQIDTYKGILGAVYNLNYRGYSNSGKIYCFYKDYKLREIQIDTLYQSAGNLLELFQNKYGDCDYYANNGLNNEYHWIKGNQHVTLYSFKDSDRLLVQVVNTDEKMKRDEINLMKNWGLSFKG